MNTSELPGGSDRIDRRQHDVREPIVEDEGDDHADADGGARTDDARPKLVEMLEETHPAFASVIVRRVGRKASKLWAHDADSSRRPAFGKKGFRMDQTGRRRLAAVL